MRTRVLLIVTALLVFGLFALQRGSAQGNPANFMRVKLAHSQRILEALALEDYQAIAENAEQLRLLSLDANWQVLQTVEYARHSAEFRRTAQSLIEAADKKNLDSAALAYVQLTLNCVNCHKYVRTEDLP